MNPRLGLEKITQKTSSTGSSKERRGKRKLGEAEKEILLFPVADLGLWLHARAFCTNFSYPSLRAQGVHH
jgi:hypothetical protein